ncbi:uncharacterized protein LOC130014025 [Patella vulgata]|uniref:uncharacterized protein LOC130014025 n=1 Tax=Patella vulgata TaxID=6465 RepID=UPI0024A7CC99|nr:uncharacterized protein LOC130014025 [Patella vulgata]
MVHQLEPRYHIPSRTHFTNNVIPQIYAQTKEIVNQKLNEADFVSITTDGWTSRSTQSFITVTAHFLKPLQTVTTLLCSEQTPTISIILPLKKKIIESVEPVFSTAGDIVSAQRNCLHPDNVDILIFLKNNFNLS